MFGTLLRPLCFEEDFKKEEEGQDFSTAASSSKSLFLCVFGENEKDKLFLIVQAEAFVCLTVAE